MLPTRPATRLPIARPPALASTLAAVLCALAVPLHAQTLPPPQNVVTLSASATVEVPQDWLRVVFSTTREGSDAAAVQSQLQQALEAALAEARRSAKPGALEVQTGNFSLYPRYAPPAPRGTNGGAPGGITGWQGSAEMIVEGRDAPAIAALAGRIRTLTIARTGFLLSREAREKREGEVEAEAIARFRARADAVARQFGFSGWTLREVQVVGSEPPQYQPQPQMRMSAAMASADQALPVEAGKATVSANVIGSVQLVK